MRAHYLQHVPFEGLGNIETWLETMDYTVSSTQFFDTEVLPEVQDIDLLIVMGGPMSVHDESAYPWLRAEKAFIRSAIETGKSVLGICLGAQLIACAMGGEVFPNSVKEIGWFPIEGMCSTGESTFQFPKKVEAFHWHGETFSLPMGAVQLAKSAGCSHQAFQLGNQVIGLQFHLETTPASAKAIIEHCKDELVEGEFIQSEAEMLAVPQARYLAIESIMASILDYLHVSNA